MAEEFGANAGDVEITVDISGTGGGFERFCNGETDSQTRRARSRKRRSRPAPRPASSYYEFEVAYDGLSVRGQPGERLGRPA